MYSCIFSVHFSTGQRCNGRVGFTPLSVGLAKVPATISFPSTPPNPPTAFQGFAIDITRSLLSTPSNCLPNRIRHPCISICKPHITVGLLQWTDYKINLCRWNSTFGQNMILGQMYLI